MNGAHDGFRNISDWELFRVLGRSMIDDICKYYKDVESRPVRAQVESGYLRVRYKYGGK